MIQGRGQGPLNFKSRGGWWEGACRCQWATGMGVPGALPAYYPVNGGQRPGPAVTPGARGRPRPRGRPGGDAGEARKRLTSGRVATLTLAVAGTVTLAPSCPVSLPPTFPLQVQRALMVQY
jgi:hypothetical protein